MKSFNNNNCDCSESSNDDNHNFNNLFEDDWGEDNTNESERKIKVKSKKQKSNEKLQKLVKLFYKTCMAHEFINALSILDDINKHLSHNKKYFGSKMPKWFVKHICLSIKEIQLYKLNNDNLNLNNKEEENIIKSEIKACNKLLKKFKKFNKIVLKNIKLYQQGKHEWWSKEDGNFTIQDSGDEEEIDNIRKKKVDTDDDGDWPDSEDDGNNNNDNTNNDDDFVLPVYDIRDRRFWVKREIQIQREKEKLKNNKNDEIEIVDFFGNTIRVSNSAFDNNEQEEDYDDEEFKYNELEDNNIDEVENNKHEDNILNTMQNTVTQNIIMNDEEEEEKVDSPREYTLENYELDDDLVRALYIENNINEDIDGSDRENRLTDNDCNNEKKEFKVKNNITNLLCIENNINEHGIAFKKIISKEKEIVKKDKWSATKIKEEFENALNYRRLHSTDDIKVINLFSKIANKCDLLDNLDGIVASLTVKSLLVSYIYENSIRKKNGLGKNRWNYVTQILLNMINILNTNIGSIRMSTKTGIKILNNIKCNEKVEVSKEIKFLQELIEVEGENNDNKKDRIHDDTEEENELNSDGMLLAYGDIWSLVKQLRDELWKNLKSIDIVKDKEKYNNRLNDIYLLLKLLKKTKNYYNKLLNQDNTSTNIRLLAEYKNILSDISCVEMSLIYTNYVEDDDVINKSKNEKLKKSHLGELKFLELPNTIIVKHAKECFSKNIYLNKLNDKKLLNSKKKIELESMLYLIYNMSLHNRYNLCKNLLLMSHLSSNESICKTNASLQILYNRTLAQFALCAFKYCEFKAVTDILSELFGSDNVTVLLGQGICLGRKKYGVELTHKELKEKELQEKRLVPSHLYLNRDTLESCYLLSSIFIEMPKMVIKDRLHYSTKNRYFKKRWDFYHKRNLRTPPEKSEEIIFTLGDYMQNGEVNKCIELNNKLKLWNNIKNSKQLIKKINNEIKVHCLKCYLFRYGPIYKSISVNSLKNRFQVQQNQVRTCLSKIILSANKTNFHLSFNDTNDTIEIHSALASKVERLTLKYVNVLEKLMEHNEKIIGIRNNHQISNNSWNTPNSNRYKLPNNKNELSKSVNCKKNAKSTSTRNSRSRFDNTQV